MNDKPAVLIIGGLGMANRPYLYTLTAFKSLAKIFTPPASCPKKEYDYVFNCGGETRYSQEDAVYKARSFELTVNLARECARRKTPAFVEFSTGQIYKPPNSSTVKAGGCTEDAATKPWTKLAKYKLLAEEELEKLRKSEGLAYVILRLGHVYGPYDVGFLARGLCLAKVYERKQEEMKWLWTKELRVNTVHVEDVCSAAFYAAQWCTVAPHSNTEKAGLSNRTFNIVDQGDTSQGTLTSIFCQIFDVKTGFQGSLISSFAKFNMESVVDDVNEDILGPWADLLKENSITDSGPLSPFMEKELLRDCDLCLDPAKARTLLRWEVAKGRETLTADGALSVMETDLAADSEFDSMPRRGRPAKRRKLNGHSLGSSPSNTYTDGQGDSSISTKGSPDKDKENDNPEEPKPKRSKYRIHEPSNPFVPEDAFFTQPPSRSPSPYRIDKFRWQKPRQPSPLPVPADQTRDLNPTRPGNLPSTSRSRISTTIPDAIHSSFTGTSTTLNLSGRPVETKPVAAQTVEAFDDYDHVLDDLPSDAFSSPEPPRLAHLEGPVVLSSQEPDLQDSSSQVGQPQRIVPPLANLRQTTLFGTQAQEAQASTQSVRKSHWPKANKDEPPTHHSLDPTAMQTWVYPTNLGKIRDYQYSIVSMGLYHNMLVALPTGLGKTFIAATIMLNWYRWTTDAQIVFVAPTKPLVSQQVKACFEIAGIPRSATTMLTGGTPPALRAEEWRSKRVFFMTPQTIQNDVKTGICDPKRIVLMVVDEAHRATGNYAYVDVIRFIRRFNQSFRVLALTATPGSSVEGVQEVIDGLGISRIEIRTEESIDIREYVYARKIDTVLFDNSDEMVMIMDLFGRALQPLVDILNRMNAYWQKDPMNLTPYGCNQAQKKWMSSDPGRKANWGLKNMMMSIFSLLASLAHGIEMLKFHGIGPFYRKVLAFRNETRDAGGKGSKYRKQVDEAEPFQTMMTRIHAWISNPDFIGHPKLEYLQNVVYNHFLDAGEGQGAIGPSNTRIMIFAHFRDSAEEIVRILKRQEPMIRPHVFVGQANSQGSDGMDQKTQLSVIERFKTGVFNTLVATSIGEEGLDIGEVDLIVCYDASASPIRMLQRMGRTGRKRAGNIVVTLMKGKEENNFVKAKDNYEKMQREIASGTRFNYHEEESRRILPRDVHPVVDKRVIEIPVENTQADLPEPSKRRKVPKRPPKKFHMPDGVRRGFVKASRIDSDSQSDNTGSNGKARRVRRSESSESLPELKDVLLGFSEQRELERRYLDVGGESPESVEHPRMDAFPSLQREMRPTSNVPHGQLTTRTVQLLGKMHDYASGVGLNFESHLHPDDRSEILSQANKRAAFFARTASAAKDSAGPSMDSEALKGSFDALPTSSVPIRHTSQNRSIHDSIRSQGSQESDPSQTSLQSYDAPSLKPRKPRESESSPRHSLSEIEDEDEEEEEDLPEFGTFLRKSATVLSAAVADGTGKTESSQRRTRKTRVIMEDSDED
ncbi:MAG: hypothetical protein Q9174_000878 [Haloplaca sp. 1 TL-2023]